MEIKSNAALLSDNNIVIKSQTTPESITETSLGELLDNIIFSSYNKIDDLFVKEYENILKADLGVKISSKILKAGQWYKIIDRADGFPLFILATTNELVAPFGVWYKNNKSLLVGLDYVNSYNGESNPFLFVIDENRKFYLNPLSNNDNHGLSGFLKVTESLNFGELGAVATGSSYSINVTCQGAILGDVVMLGLPNNIPSQASFYKAYVSSNNIVTIKFTNISGGNITPLEGDFSIMILK